MKTAIALAVTALTGVWSLLVSPGPAQATPLEWTCVNAHVIGSPPYEECVVNIDPRGRVIIFSDTFLEDIELEFLEHSLDNVVVLTRADVADTIVDAYGELELQLTRERVAFINVTYL